MGGLVDYQDRPRRCGVYQMSKSEKPRPVHSAKRGVISRHRLPPSEPLVPGLRRGGPIELIGFLDAGLISEAKAERELRKLRNGQ